MRSPTCLGFVLVTAAACGSPEGDLPSKPRPNLLGDGQRLHKILGPAEWESDDPMDEGCDFPSDRDVRVTGVVVVAIDRYDETGAGADGNFYVQDALDEPIAYSGVTVF